MSPYMGPSASTRVHTLVLTSLSAQTHTLPDTAPAHNPSVDSRHIGKVAGTIQKPQSQARS